VHRSSIVVGCLVSAFALAPLLAGPTGRADIGPRAAALGGVTFPTGTNGCTGPLVGVYGSSAAKAFILQAARDYCATFATPSSAPDVEYADGGASCPGLSYASSASDANEVGVSTVFPNSCGLDGVPALDPSMLVDTVLGVNVVEEIATCPGAQQPNGGAVNPAGPTQCGAFSTDPGASGAVSCSPAGISLAQAQLLYTQAIGNERGVGGCNHSNAVQNRIAGSGTRITFCFNVFGAGSDNCANEGSSLALAPTTGTEVNDVCAPSPGAGYDAQGYVSRADVVADPRSGSAKTALQGCGVVTVGGFSGYNGTCDPDTSVSQCPGDADVASGRYQIWGYLHLVTNANTANNAAARGFVNFVTPANLGGQDQEEALLVQSGFVPTCEMQFARSVDAGPYVATTGSASCALLSSIPACGANPNQAPHWRAVAQSGNGNSDIGTELVTTTPLHWFVDQSSNSTMDEAAWLRTYPPTNPTAAEGGFFSGYWPYDTTTGFTVSLVPYATINHGSTGYLIAGSTYATLPANTGILRVRQRINVPILRRIRT